MFDENSMHIQFFFQDIVRYSFVPQSDLFNPNINKGLDYFYILESSGLVYLKAPLTTDPTEDTRYTVCCFSFYLDWFSFISSTVLRENPRYCYSLVVVVIIVIGMQKL